MQMRQSMEHNPYLIEGESRRMRIPDYRTDKIDYKKFYQKRCKHKDCYFYQFTELRLKPGDKAKVYHRGFLSHRIANEPTT